MTEKGDQELRLPKLTGNEEQCYHAERIRARFSRNARAIYQDDEKFGFVIKLFSYEAHALFWIGVRDNKLEGVIGKIVRNNPSVQELIDLFTYSN